MKQKLELLRKVDAPALQKQKTQSKPGKTATNKSISMSIGLQNTSSNNMNTSLTPDTSVILPPLDYNIVEDMKKPHTNISFFNLAKIQSQRDILLHALEQTSTESATSTNKGASTPPGSLSIVLNTLQMEEANSYFPPFLLSLEIFNYNVHNCLVDFGATANYYHEI